MSRAPTSALRALRIEGALGQPYIRWSIPWSTPWWAQRQRALSITWGHSKFWVATTTLGLGGPDGGDCPWKRRDDCDRPHDGPRQRCVSRLTLTCLGARVWRAHGSFKPERPAGADGAECGALPAAWPRELLLVHAPTYSAYDACDACGAIDGRARAVAAAASSGRTRADGCAPLDINGGVECKRGRESSRNDDARCSLTSRRSRRRPPSHPSAALTAIAAPGALGALSQAGLAEWCVTVSGSSAAVASGAVGSFACKPRERERAAGSRHGPCRRRERRWGGRRSR